MSALNASLRTLRDFARDERGVVTVEFVLIFPIFFAIFLMIFESGMISLRTVMLERGVDLAVRDVRIGRLPNPSRNDLRARICEIAEIIPNCLTQLDLEMTRNDPTNWTNISANAKCVDRGNINNNDEALDLTANNQLMILRVCARVDPFFPTSLLGKSIAEASTSSAADGSMAIVSTAAFVVEPFRADNN